jgi:hypothetical protein
MKGLQALLLAATGVARAVAQATGVGSMVVGGYANVSGAPLAVITESLQTRQGR